MMSLNRIGDYYFRQGSYAKGIEYSTQALRVATEIKDSIGMADAYRLLGNINTLGLKKYDVALEHQLKAMHIYERQDDKRKLAALYSSMTWIYAITNQQLALAHTYTDKAIQISKQLGDNQVLSYSYNSKGLIYKQEGALDSALHYLKKSIITAVYANDRTIIAYNKTIIGTIYLQQKKYTEATDLFQQGMRESKIMNAREILSEAYSGLAKSYEQQQRYKQALQFLLLYTHLKDSLLSQETTQKVVLIQLEYEQNKKVAQIASLEYTNRMFQREKWAYIIVFTGGLLLLSVVLSLIVKNNQHRKKNNRNLQEKNEEIETQNEELLQHQQEIALQQEVVEKQNEKLQQVNAVKDKLFSIIGHDMRGPIASLKILLELVAREVVTADEFKLYAPKLSHSVSNIHETLENLLQWSYTQMQGLSSAPIKLAMHDIIENTISLFAESAKAKNITITNEIVTVVTVYADENQVKLIFRNLINNAIKFTPDSGSIRIYSHMEEHFVAIAIADTGMGMSKEGIARLWQSNAHFTSQGTSGEKGTGLGLLLCKEMAESNGGKIEVTSEAGKGSVFTVYLLNEVIQ